ncbi:MAG: peptide ABC transporter permease, partial [Microbacterium sp.]
MSAATAVGAERAGAAPGAADAGGMPRAAAGALARLRERGMGATVLVAGISSAFGVLLLSATGYISAWAGSESALAGRTATIVIGMLSVLLIGVAVYVAAIVTANTFATIVAGRTRQIALLRLIGASAQSQRRAVAGQGAAVGAIGAVIGLVAGIVAAALLLQWADAALGISTGYQVLQPVLLLPAVVVCLTTWAGAWSGSRRVLSVTPLEAIAGAAPRTHEDVRGSKGRSITALVLSVAGAALLAGGVALGLRDPIGVVVAFFGGILSFTGLSLGAVVVMPPLLRLTGRMFGRSATARLAAENALRHP